MLDVETKRRIDEARDILVGKVPDPKSQVEQITIALTYKFMDDMDKESVALGGKPTFFVGEYEKYGWSKIFSPQLGGFDLINTYGEALEVLDENSNIPQLFRDIFKNAFLPYRDPETLRSFLKIINEFTYDHSEKLGDAYEYLLSVLGSQGDAGQFRTPRHIIDFIVNVVDPQKNETVLDPACGTAGFLISSYRHIIGHNTNERPGDRLTPDEKNKLINNFVGYDISPDMVRLSLMNMYLHSFPSPHIFEYDTLTSEERWQDTFDIIMANPPFMTPKGGIRPHKRFSTQAKRSEVLFVDYIMEHLNANGRAGVIVPEGIIFQSQNAYRELRKQLVDGNYLYAVASLPAGVFNPYAGVKTSILFIDKTLAKKTDNILFVKIENDGFDLGAQRREIEANDLPYVLGIIKRLQVSLKQGFEFTLNNEEKKQSVLTSKDSIRQNSYSLTSERYREAAKVFTEWPLVNLSAICMYERTLSTINDSELPYVGMEDVESATGKISKNVLTQKNNIGEAGAYIFSDRHVLYGRLRPYLNKVALPDFKGRCSTELIPIACKAQLNRMYLAYILRSQQLIDFAMQSNTGARMPRTDLNALKDFKIPLPPISIQEQIVAELEGYQKIIDGARQVVDNYKPFVRENEDWELVKVGEICALIGGGTPSKEKEEYWCNGTIKWISCKHIVGDYISESDQRITEIAVRESSTNVVPEGAILMVSRVSLGKIAMAKDSIAINQDITALIVNNQDVVNIKYLFHVLKNRMDYVQKSGQGLGVKGITKEFIKEIKVPIPSSQIQQRIAEQMAEEEQLIEANKRLIEIYEGKIKDKINEVWGEF